MSSEIFEKCRGGVLTSCNYLRNPLSVLLYSTVFCIFATQVSATDYSIDCPSGTASGTSCYQYTCGSNCTATLIGDKMTISGTGAMTNYSGTGTGCNGSSDCMSSNAPWYCQITSITSVDVADGITSIGNAAFTGAMNITSVNFGQNSQLTTIGSHAFRYNQSLSSINIPNTVTSIGGTAFYDTESWANVNIPSGVTTISSYAFVHTAATSITIPEGVTTIDNCAFCYSPNLTHVEIPDTVTTIGANAFHSTANLKSIVIPDSVTSIGKNAFAYQYGYNGVNSSSVIEKIYCSEAQKADGGPCSASSLANAAFSGSVYTYVQDGDHYNIYDSNGQKVGAYRNMSDFGSVNVFKRTSYSPAEAAKHLHKGNDNFITFTFK